MKNRPGDVTLIWATVFLAIGLTGFSPNLWAATDDARVTRIIRDVKLLPSEAKPKPAVLNEKVGDGTGVRTGDQSRSELTFADLTIERLGANTVFSFNRGGRSVRLNNGSMLLRVPKDSGGADLSTSAVTVGITGTTVILETGAGRNKLTVLEGGARVSLNKYKGQSVYVRGGQMEDVPAGASKLPPPVNINLSNLMRRNPLITDFPPLPSQDLITARSGPPIIPTIMGVGLGPLRGGGSGGTHTNRRPTGGRTGNIGNSPNNPKGNANIGNNQPQPHGAANRAGRNVASPTPTPSRKNKKNTGNG